MQIQRNLSEVTVMSAESLNEVMAEACVTLFPVQPQSTLKPWQQSSVQVGIKQMWMAYRALRSCPDWSLQSIFTAWRNFTVFHRAHRAFRQAGRVARRAWRLEKLAEAERACKHDSFRLYTIIRSLAPKSKHRRVRLRGPEGRMLSTEEELATLQRHCEAVFCKDAKPMEPEHVHTLADLHIQEAEIAMHIKQIPTMKAAPKSRAPALAWHMGGAIVTQTLMQIIGSSQQGIPQSWKDAWLVFLPKVLHPRVPRDLRPIGLQDIGGKAVLHVIRDRLLPYVQQALEDLPQFAYVPGRATRHRIARALHHCSRVRQALQHRPLDLYQRRRGDPRPQTEQLGGVQVSVDMSQAFDRLNRDQLQQIMKDMGIPGELRWLVAAWHQEMCYHVQHGSMHLSLSSTTGVRQGCKIAPQLWTLLSCHILRRIGELTSEAWMKACNSFFADDLHFSYDIMKAGDLEKIAPFCSMVFQVLQDCNMLVNFKKSAVLVALQGTAAKKWCHRNIVKNQEGKWLRVRVGANVALLPVRDEHKYLGVVLSYRAFEQATVTLRLAQATGAFTRLRGILCSRAKFNLPERVRLWSACVGTTLYYGLAVTGLQAKQVKQIRAVVHRQLRAVARSPSHLSRESNAALLQRLQVLDPVQFLINQNDKMIRDACQAPHECRGFVLEDPQWLGKVRDGLLLHVPHGPMSSGQVGLRELPVSTRVHACPECGQYFASC